MNQLRYSKGIVTGDTRIDRVMDIARQPKSLEFFDKNEGKPILVAGSTWPADEFILKDFIRSIPNHKIILAPHDPSSTRVAGLIQLFDQYKPIVHSQWKGQPYQVMIIDSIGLLNRLYAYAQAAYIGGGFGKGIHNILEPAAYGIPIFFGPKYHSFIEAEEMIKVESAFSIKNANELKSSWKKTIPTQLTTIKNITGQYFADHKGATAQIIDYLRDFIG